MLRTIFERGLPRKPKKIHIYGGSQRPLFYVHFGILAAQWTKWTEKNRKCDINLGKNMSNIFFCLFEYSKVA